MFDPKPCDLELQVKLAERRESEQRILASHLADGRGTAERRCSNQATPYAAAASDRKSSETYERKMSALSCSGSVGGTTAEEEELSLQLIEKRQLRSFSRADEYLYAMKVGFI